MFKLYLLMVSLWDIKLLYSIFTNALGEVLLLIKNNSVQLIYLSLGILLQLSLLFTITF